MREQVADGRARWPRRLVKLDHAFLGRHERGERRQELGDRGPGKRCSPVADCARFSVRTGNAHSRLADGPNGQTVLTYLDAQGERVTLSRTADGAVLHTYDDGSLLAPSRNALIEQGMHRLLQFDLVTTKVYHNAGFGGTFDTKTIWLLNQNYLVFTNNNRNDVGIPEPTTFGMLAAAGSMAVVCRRQRRKGQLA